MPLVRKRPTLLEITFLFGWVLIMAAIIYLFLSGVLFRVADYLNPIINRVFVVVGPESFYTMLALFGIWLSVLFLVIAVHEFGHVIAGMIMGFHFQAVFIGYLSFMRRKNRIKLQVHNSVPSDGMAIMDIPLLPRLRKRLLFYVAAGPAANLICTTVSLLFMWVAVVQHVALLRKAVVIFIGWSLFIGLVSLIPRHFRGLTTDGAKLLILLRSPGRSRRWLSILALRRQLKANIRPHDWNGHWALSAGSIIENTWESLDGNWLAYLRAKSRKEIPEAANYLERCLQLYSIADPQFRDTLCWAATVFTGRFRNDVRRALAWYKRIRKPEKLSPLFQLSAKLAIASSHNKFDAALKICQEALELIRRSPLLPPYEIDAWIEWQQEIEERRASSLEMTAEAD
jgi:hypothetical protein